MQLTFGNMTFELNTFKLMRQQAKLEEFPNDDCCLIETLVWNQMMNELEIIDKFDESTVTVCVFQEQTKKKKSGKELKI